MSHRFSHSFETNETPPPIVHTQSSHQQSIDSKSHEHANSSRSGLAQQQQHFRQGSSRGDPIGISGSLNNGSSTTKRRFNNHPMQSLLPHQSNSNPGFTRFQRLKLRNGPRILQANASGNETGVTDDTPHWRSSSVGAKMGTGSSTARSNNNADVKLSTSSGESLSRRKKSSTGTKKKVSTASRKTRLSKSQTARSSQREESLSKTPSEEPTKQVSSSATESNPHHHSSNPLTKSGLTSINALTWLIETAQQLNRMNSVSENSTSMSEVLYAFQSLDQLVKHLEGAEKKPRGEEGSSTPAPPSSDHNSSTLGKTESSSIPRSTPELPSDTSTTNILDLNNLQKLSSATIRKHLTNTNRSHHSSVAVQYLHTLLQNLQTLFYRHVFDMEGNITTTHKDEIVKMPFFEEVKEMRHEEELNKHQKEQEEIFERMSHEQSSMLGGKAGSASDYLEQGNMLSRFKKLKKEHAEQEKFVKKLHEKLEEKEKIMRKMYQEFHEELSLRDNAYSELEKKHQKTSEILTTLTRELNELRSYKQQNEKFERFYMTSKNEYHKKGLTNMFSYQTQAEVILQLHQQMEMIENERLDRYGSDISNRLFSANDTHSQHTKSQFVNDVSLLTEEMTQLTDKVDELAATFETDEQIAKKRHRASNQEFSKVLKFIDPKRFRSYIEIHTTDQENSDKKFKLLHRQTVTPHHEPFDFALPPHTKRMRIVFAQYSHDRDHPNPAINIKNSDQFAQMFESKIAKFVDFHIPENSNLWRGYKAIYGSKGPAASRKIPLLQLREFIHLVYEEYWNRLCQYNSKTVLQCPSFWSTCFDVVKSNYVLPEVVMKATFEILTAIEEFSDGYPDVTEFRLSIEGRNDTSTGRCMNLALYIIRRIWLGHARDYGQKVDRKTVNNLLRLIYFDVPAEALRQIEKEFFESDVEYHEENAYPIEHFNKYFITSFRDYSEYWCSLTLSFLKKHVQTRERLHKADFLHYIEILDAGADLDRLAARFVEACQQSVNPTTRQLHISRLAVLYAESKWVNYWQAMKTHTSSTTGGST